jgi:hypothetical protein
MLCCGLDSGVSFMSMSSRALGAALAVALAMSASVAQAERLSLDLQVRELVDKIFESDLKACKAQNGRLLKLIADPRFAQQAPRTQGLAYVAAISCAPDGGAQAVTAARSLVQLPVDPRIAYFGHETLMTDAQERGATDDYLTHLYAAIDADPTLIAKWKTRYLYWILTQVKDDPAKEVALLDRFHTVPWTDREAQDSDRNSWAVRRARRFVEAGQRSKARTVLEGVTHVDDLLTVAQDRRFEPLWPDLETDGRFAWVKLAEAELAAEQARMKAEPSILQPVSEAMASLRALGRHDEAVALGEAYAARLRKGETFTDADDQRAWMLNSLA